MQLDPNRRDGEGMWRMDGRVEEGGCKRSRAEEMRQERKAEARQVGRRRKGRRRKLGEAEEGREGWPFEPGAAFEFQPDFKTIQVWSKIRRFIFKN